MRSPRALASGRLAGVRDRKAQASKSEKRTRLEGSGMSVVSRTVTPLLCVAIAMAGSAAPAAAKSPMEVRSFSSKTAEETPCPKVALQPGHPTGGCAIRTRSEASAGIVLALNHPLLGLLARFRCQSSFTMRLDGRGRGYSSGFRLAGGEGCGRLSPCRGSGRGAAPWRTAAYQLDADEPQIHANGWRYSGTLELAVCLSTALGNLRGPATIYLTPHEVHAVSNRVRGSTLSITGHWLFTNEASVRFGRW